MQKRLLKKKKKQKDFLNAKIQKAKRLLKRKKGILTIKESKVL